MILLAGLVYGACPAPGEAAALRQAEVEAVGAMAALDDAAFEAAVERARGTLACLEAPVSPVAAAAWHRTEALAAFAAGDAAGARAALRAALAIDPDGRLPEVVAPKGGALDLLAEEARAAGAPKRGRRADVWFDGEKGAGRPLEVPTILQAHDAGAWTTRVLAADEPWAPPPWRLERRAVPVLVVSGAAVAGAGALYAVSAVSRSAYDDLDDPVPTSDLPALQARTNGALVGSAALGALGLVGIGVALAW